MSTKFLVNNKIKQLPKSFMWESIKVCTFTFSSRMCSGLRETGFSMATRQRTCKQWKIAYVNIDRRRGYTFKFYSNIAMILHGIKIVLPNITEAFLSNTVATVSKLLAKLRTGSTNHPLQGRDPCYGKTWFTVCHTLEQTGIKCSNSPKSRTRYTAT